jgi:hypothetical protein
LLAQRERLQIAWLLAEGRLFDSQPERSFPYADEEVCRQPSFVPDIIDMLLKYEAKYETARGLSLNRVRESLEGSLRINVGANEKEREPDEDPANAVVSELERLLASLKAALPLGRDHLLGVFEELHQLVRKPKVRNILE